MTGYLIRLYISLMSDALNVIRKLIIIFLYRIRSDQKERQSDFVMNVIRKTQYSWPHSINLNLKNSVATGSLMV